MRVLQRAFVGVAALCGGLFVATVGFYWIGRTAFLLFAKIQNKVAALKGGGEETATLWGLGILVSAVIAVGTLVGLLIRMQQEMQRSRERQRQLYQQMTQSSGTWLTPMVQSATVTAMGITDYSNIPMPMESIDEYATRVGKSIAKPQPVPLSELTQGLQRGSQDRIKEFI